MENQSLRVWRILEEEQPSDLRTRIITKKQFVAEFHTPRHRTYLTIAELVQQFGEGYYLVEIPAAIRKDHVLPEAQLIRTPSYFEPSSYVKEQGNRFIYLPKEGTEDGTQRNISL